MNSNNKLKIRGEGGILNQRQVTGDGDLPSIWHTHK